MEDFPVEEDVGPIAGGDADDYWHLARQPLHTLLFLLPFLLLYEAGVQWAGGAPSCRGGADCLVRAALGGAGVTHWWAPPAIVASLLLAWHVAGQYRWNISPAALCGMLAESVLFGLALVVLGQLQDLAMRELEAARLLAALDEPRLETLGRAVGFVGAGIYEELLFRGALLPVIWLVLRGAALPRSAALTAAVVISSVLFAAAHYWGPYAAAVDFRGFAFRALAGVVFAVLLVLRGMGITIGAHVAYDIVVGVFMRSEA